MICAIHGTEMVLKPAGTSKKTGKPYPAFWSCPEKNEDGSYCNFKPDRQGAYGNATPTPRIDSYFTEPVPKKTEKDDAFWARQGCIKTLCGMANARLAGLRPVEEVIKELPKFMELYREIQKTANDSEIPF